MELSDLSPEMQEKVMQCDTPEKLLELAKEGGYQLTDEELENISGGWVPWKEGVGSRR